MNELFVPARYARIGLQQFKLVARRARARKAGRETLRRVVRNWWNLQKAHVWRRWSERAAARREAMVRLKRVVRRWRHMEIGYGLSIWRLMVGARQRALHVLDSCARRWRLRHFTHAQIAKHMQQLMQ